MSAPLIFVPGWCLGRGPWQPTATALGGTLVDLPGYGDAPAINDFDAAARQLAAAVPAGAILCGWSLGALLALAAAAAQPSKLAKLVLVSGTASFTQRADWPDAMAPDQLAQFAAAVAADAQGALPRFIANFNRGDARAKAVSRELIERTDPLPPAATLATGLDWLRDVDLRPLAGRVTTPTLLLHGERDPLMPFAAAEALVALLPNARLEAFADCAHAPFISDPAAFQARLAAFVHDPAA